MLSSFTSPPTALLTGFSALDHADYVENRWTDLLALLN